MIKIAGDAIIVHNPDGSSEFFDMETLKVSLSSCLVDAEITEQWVLDDISLAIECALLSSKERSISWENINKLIIKTLIVLGFSNIAEVFMQQNNIIHPTAELSKEYIASILKKNISLSELNLVKVTDKIIDSLSILDIKFAKQELILELGKHYKQNFFQENNAQVAKKKFYKPNKSVLTIKKENLLIDIPKSLQYLIENNIIKLYGVSELFPSIRIKYDISKMIAFHKTPYPLTEMLIIPFFDDIAQVADIIINTTNKLYKTDSELPVFITVENVKHFAEVYLNSNWPGVEKACYELFLELIAIMKNNVVKLGIEE